VPKAVILLSGGLDSATVGAMARAEGYELYALSFRYGQRHAVELQAADRVARMLGVKEHKTAEIDLRLFGGSALTDDIAVPKDRDDSEMAEDIPVTYVPARNTIFLSFALAYAEVLEARDIFIGVNAVDYSGYPDCRPEFISAFQQMANVATACAVDDSGGGISIHTPLITMTKAEIIQTGAALNVDYAKTLSCYDPDETSVACGKCDSCKLRAKGFLEAGIPDPTRYR
jgi:7-cyano-7-deazaguanine synthase